MTQVNDVLIKVGQNLKKAIANSKFKTQAQFAENGMFCDEKTVRRWIKNGVTNMATIIEIANVLGIDDFTELLK